jgi:hypothetical protein
MSGRMSGRACQPCKIRKVKVGQLDLLILQGTLQLTPFLLQ